MPLRDQFRPPISNHRSWEGFHGGWPIIVQRLVPAAAFLLTASAFIAGAAAVADPVRTAGQPVVEALQSRSQEIARELRSNVVADQHQREDCFGDPLPLGAIARLGTTRLRHGGATTAVQFTADGTALITMGVDGLRIWDVATGKSLQRLEIQKDRRLGTGILSADCKQVVEALGIGLANNPVLRLWELPTGRLLREFGDHIAAGCFSPDGKLLATVGTSQPHNPQYREFVNRISLWDLTTGQRLKSWTGHQDGIYSCLVSLDGKMLITAGGDKTIRFWDVASGREVRQGIGTKKGIVQLTLSLDGKFLAGIGLKEGRRDGFLFPSGLGWYADNSVHVWDVASGKQLQEITVPRSSPRDLHAITFAGFTPDNKSLVTGGPDRFARTWDLATGKEVRHFDFGGNLWGLALSPDGKTLVGLPNAGRSLRLIDTASGADRLAGRGHRDGIFWTLLTPDNKTAITTANGECEIIVWDRASGQERLRLKGHESIVAGLALSEDGRTLYSTSYLDGNISVWDISTGKLLRRFRKPATLEHEYTMLALTPDGKTLALAQRQGKTVFLLDSATGKETSQLIRKGGVAHVAFTPEGLALGVVATDLSVRLWNWSTGDPLPEGVPSTANPVKRDVKVSFGHQAFALSPDCNLLASVNPKGFPALLDLSTLKYFPGNPKAGPGISVFAFSPDQRMLAWSDCHGPLTRYEPIIHLMETATSKERRQFAGHQGWVASLAFSSDGRTLASGSVDTSVLLWDLCEGLR